MPVMQMLQALKNITNYKFYLPETEFNLAWSHIFEVGLAVILDEIYLIKVLKVVSSNDNIQQISNVRMVEHMQKLNLTKHTQTISGVLEDALNAFNGNDFVAPKVNRFGNLAIATLSNYLFNNVVWANFPNRWLAELFAIFKQTYFYSFWLHR